jgi:hypothetical protein
MRTSSGYGGVLSTLDKGQAQTIAQRGNAADVFQPPLISMYFLSIGNPQF